MYKMDQAHEKWQEIIDYVKANNTITEEEYKTWLEPLRPFGCGDGKFTALYDTREEWPLVFIQERYGKMIEEAVRYVMGLEIQFKAYKNPNQDLKEQIKKNEKKWKNFTVKLRKLMREYPELPVVVGFCGGSMHNGDVDCSVSDYCDGVTNELLARMILIHNINAIKDEMPEI